MSVRIGLLFVLISNFSVAAVNIEVASSCSAQIRVTATVIEPIGFYDNSTGQIEGNIDNSDIAIIDICHPANAGIILTINNYNRLIRQYRFPSDAGVNRTAAFDKADRKPISLERVMLFPGDCFLQDSCLITLIYSEN